MDNEQANSELGKASRALAFALLTAVYKEGSRGDNVNALQETLFHYGEAIIDRLRG